MPAMITHYLLGKRVLLESGIPPIPRRDAFFLGLQGPDIFYFHRAYPWLFGKSGFSIGNDLHEVAPSLLFDTLAEILHDTPKEDRPIMESYIFGFLCHYAADCKIHPYVIDMQQRMQLEDPTFATDSNPYHYRIESALDAQLLRHDQGEYVTAFSLRTLVPKRDKRRDAVIADGYQRLLAAVLQQGEKLRWLSHLTEDFRHSMWLMTDHTEWKGKAVRFAERLAKSGAKLSPLLRTKEVDWYDFVNEKKRPWNVDADTVSDMNFYELCDDTVRFSVSLLDAFDRGVGGSELTQDIDFAGKMRKEAEA